MKNDPKKLRLEIEFWYKQRTKKDFIYSALSKEETDVNCSPQDTFIQTVSCAININRDRNVVGIIGTLFKKYHRIMVVYGTGHFVQEYPALLKGFGKAPDFLNGAD